MSRFEVLRGEILGIIGPNGAGKTTLFNLLNGFLAAGPGSVLLDGRTWSGASRTSCATQASAALSRSCARSSRMSVADNVVVGAYVHAADRRGGAPPRRRSHRDGRTRPTLLTASAAS